MNYFILEIKYKDGWGESLRGGGTPSKDTIINIAKGRAKSEGKEFDSYALTYITKEQYDGKPETEIFSF